MGFGISQALESAPQTKCLELSRGALQQTAGIFERFFSRRPALVVADPTTFRVAGQMVLSELHRLSAGTEAWVFSDPDFYAEHRFVERLESRLKEWPEAIPVAVGSGTINDVTKLAAHRTGRPYVAVATAASMDGYTAFGASITHHGSKQTFACAAPRAVIGDLEVLRRAPADLTAAGYADLLAKITAGADWLLADALGVEALHRQAWELVQGNLARAVSDPAGVRNGEPDAIRQLAEGLFFSGLAMQFAASSRPASGAEHQFSHLWDMQHHRHAGMAPLHGFKVAVGTVAVGALYEYLLKQRLEEIPVEVCCQKWLSWPEREPQVRALFDNPALAEVAVRETQAKHISAADLRRQLLALRRLWPELRPRLRAHLIPSAELKRRLKQAGAPAASEEIGIRRERLRESFRQAYFIRRRFTVLDLLVRADLLEPALDQIFLPAPQGGL